MRKYFFCEQFANSFAGKSSGEIIWFFKNRLNLYQDLVVSVQGPFFGKFLCQICFVRVGHKLNLVSDMAKICTVVCGNAKFSGTLSIDKKEHVFTVIISSLMIFLFWFYLIGSFLWVLEFFVGYRFYLKLVIFLCLQFLSF